MSDFERTRERVSGGEYQVIGTLYSVNHFYTEFTQNVNGFSPCREEITLDSIHPHHPYQGGAFDSRKRTVSYDSHYGSSGSTSDVRDYSRYTGLFPVSELAGFSANPAGYPNSDYEACKDLGPTAWNRFKPGKPVVSGSVFLAELRDLPGLMFKRLKNFRSLGNNYLAYQFGWKPFLNDITDFWKSVCNLDKQINYLRRNNGKVIKSGGDLYHEREEETNVSSASTSYVYGKNVEWATEKKVTVVDEERCWFSGRFRYYIPGLDSQKWGRARAIQELWDLKITPEQVYQLIPWSWLFDWFSNAGDVISNLQSAVDDNLVAKYAYVMLNRRHTETISVSAHTWSGSLSAKVYSPFTSKVHITNETKSRASATPFGFNFSWDGNFSPYQLSILTALGLSRSKW